MFNRFTVLFLTAFFVLAPMVHAEDDEPQFEAESTSRATFKGVVYGQGAAFKLAKGVNCEVSQASAEDITVDCTYDSETAPNQGVSVQCDPSAADQRSASMTLKGQTVSVSCQTVMHKVTTTVSDE